MSVNFHLMTHGGTGRKYRYRALKSPISCVLCHVIVMNDFLTLSPLCPDLK